MMEVTEKLKRYKILREAVFSLILISSLYGCSWITGGQSTLYPWEERKEQFLTWATSEKIKVDKGTLKNSEYWTEFYLKAMELRPDLDDFRFFANEMIKVSRIFEEGKITKEQFEDKHRQLTALLAREENRRGKIFPSSRSINELNEAELFTCYRKSLFLGYVNDLRRQLNAAGPQFSSNHCTFFGNSIQCTAQNFFFELGP
jgi:hypothetical protein